MTVSQDSSKIVFSETGLYVLVIDQNTLKPVTQKELIYEKKFIWIKLLNNGHLIAQQTDTNHLIIYDSKMKQVKKFLGHFKEGPNSEISRDCCHSFDNYTLVWMIGNKNIGLINAETFELKTVHSFFSFTDEDLMPMMAAANKTGDKVIGLCSINENVVLCIYVNKETTRKDLKSILPSCKLFSPSLNNISLFS